MNDAEKPKAPEAFQTMISLALSLAIDAGNNSGGGGGGPDTSLYLVDDNSVLLVDDNNAQLVSDP